MNETKQTMTLPVAAQIVALKDSLGWNDGCDDPLVVRDFIFTALQLMEKLAAELDDHARRGHPITFRQ